MGYNLTPRSDDPKLYGKQVARMVMDRWEQSREDSVTIRRNINRYYDLYRGFIRSRAQPFRNQVHLPLLFSAIEVGIAIKHGLLTAQKPLVEFMPSGPEDGPNARRATTLVAQQFDDADVDTKLSTILRMGDITGTAVFQWSWKTIEQTRPQRVPMPGDSTGELFAVMDQRMVDFDGPWVDVCDLLDIAFTPGFLTIREMPWVIRRYWMDFDELIEINARAMEGGTGPIFDPDGIEEVRMGQIAEESTAELDGRRYAPGGIKWATPSMRPMDRYSKPVEILEMHGAIPSEMVPEDGQRIRLITIANGVTTLRNIQNPIWNGGLPFGVYSPTPDPYSIYGIGKVEPNDKLQATASRLASQKLDAIDFLIDPMLAYNQLANVQTNKLHTKPGGLVGGDGPPNTWLQPITPDMRGLQQGIMEIESLWRWMQHGTGVSEEAMGLSGGTSDRQTAREFLGKAEAVQRRMVREALHAANVILLPLADAFRALDAQFCPFPKILRKMGQAAIIDPETGTPSPPEPVNLQDVILRYDMRPVAAASIIGRSAQQQNWTLLLQTLGPPLQNPLINWQSIYRKTFILFDEQNPDEFMMPLSPEQVMMIQMAQQMANQPANPKSSGKVGQSKSAPNSDILDQMVTPQQSSPDGGMIQ